MEKDIFKDFSPDKAMDYDLGSAYGCQISSMCSNAKQARSCFVHPACVSRIASTVFFTARLSAAARARRDDCLLVISKSLHRCSGSRQGWLVGQAGLRWDYYGLSVPMPASRALIKRAGRSLVATNGGAKSPCYHGCDSHAWGSSNINWPFPFLERF
jgi:hypothetical protein